MYDIFFRCNKIFTSEKGEESMRGTRIFSGSTYEEKANYARAVVIPDAGGEWIFVSGTTGYDYASMTIASDAAQQARQCFENVKAALREADADAGDVVRIRVYLADRKDFDAVAVEVAAFCEPSRPANTTVIAPLVDEKMLVEIEVTARRSK